MIDYEKALGVNLGKMPALNKKSIQSRLNKNLMKNIRQDAKRVKLKPHGDYDGDGVANWADCRPMNKRFQEDIQGPIRKKDDEIRFRETGVSKQGLFSRAKDRIKNTRLERRRFTKESPKRTIGRAKMALEDSIESNLNKRKTKLNQIRKERENILKGEGRRRIKTIAKKQVTRRKELTRVIPKQLKTYQTKKGKSTASSRFQKIAKKKTKGIGAFQAQGVGRVKKKAKRRSGISDIIAPAGSI